MSKMKPYGGVPAAAPPAKPADTKAGKDHSVRATRETIESIVVAVILAFLFRAFVAEAFVIPTGSMAPTLQGRHMDVTCRSAAIRYRTGASGENEGRGEVRTTICPICRFTDEIGQGGKPNQRSFNGDRILVSKFAYEVGEPKRWDVIVFKYPGNAKQNYIKRLVGLPNETFGFATATSTRVSRAASGAGTFHIARKPPHKVAGDAAGGRRHATTWPELVRRSAGRPLAGLVAPPARQPGSRRADGQGFETAGPPTSTLGCGIGIVVPRTADWADIWRTAESPSGWPTSQLQGQLITDYYAYNDGDRRDYQYPDAKSAGMHWVGDLAVDGEESKSRATRATVLLDLVEGGVHYTCRIDVATGEAVLSIDGGRQPSPDEDGVDVQASHRRSTVCAGRVRTTCGSPTATTNCCCGLNNRLVEFDGPTTYRPDGEREAQMEPARSGRPGTGRARRRRRRRARSHRLRVLARRVLRRVVDLPRKTAGS